MGKEADSRAAKQNRWGSLAARLEVQCEDILTMEAEEVGSTGAREHQPAQQNGDTGLLGSSDHTLPPPDLRRETSISSQSMAGSTTHSALSTKFPQEAWGTNLASVPYQQQLQQNELLQPQTHEACGDQFQPQLPPAASLEKTISSLKDWIVTKKVDKEIKEATSSLPSNSSGMSPYEKQRIEKCVKIAHLLVANLAKRFEGPKTNSNEPIEATVDSFDGETDDWEPKPQDISEDCITVTENAETGDVIDLGFDIYRNFNWDDTEVDDDNQSSNEQKLGLIFEALGKLLYKLFMEGEDVPPCPTSTDVPPPNGSIDGKSSDIPDEDDILDMLRKLPITGTSGDNGGNDRITSTMRNSGKLPKSLCRLVVDLLHTSTVMGRNEHGLENNQNPGSCFASLSDVHSDIQQMIDFPDAFLYSSINSRWELVFGNNHMFGRKGELRQLMDAAYRIQNSTGYDQSSTPGMPHPTQRKKEVVMVNGHAGSGKSRLVQEIRKPLQAWGWTFLRCKFGKTIQAEPLSVIALGLDEFFSSNVACLCPGIGTQGSLVTMGSSNGCSCANSSCPRKVCERLESLIGIDGLKCLSQQMPSLRSLVGETYAHRRESFNNVNGGLQGKFHTHHLFGTLLDTLASVSPVLFFVDDLQWADVASLELLTGLINRTFTQFDRDCSTNRILFVGAYRADTIMEELSLKNMIQEFDECVTINTTQISLRGFHLESLNEMVSEALCLPRRKTRSLCQIIHLKTQGFPLYVVEFLDALLTEKLLFHDPADGWEWDVDVIDLKGISKSVAELLTGKLKRLPHDILSGIQVLSCFGSHVDFDVLDAVKNYDGSSGNTLMPALYTAQKEGLVEKAGPTFTFSHDSIQHAAFDLIPTEDRIPLLQKLVSYLIPCCMQERGSDSFLFVTVDIINRIGRDGVYSDPIQSQLFARLNLEAGKKSMAATDFSSAMKHFKFGISFLQANYWEDQYDLSLNLFECSALANYSEGNHEQVAIQVNHVLSNAKSFEDKFKSYCVFINVIGIGSMERAAEKLYELLTPLGENIDPNVISPQIAISEFISTRNILSGVQKDKFLHLDPMTDRTKLMTMKLMAMLVVYYNQQQTFMSGYLVCKMIRTSLQYGHSEDTVYALSVFSAVLGNRLYDVDEGYALGRTALSLLKFYNTNQLIPRIYGVIYGTVLVSKDPIQSLLEPLLQACRLSFSNGNFEHSTINTVIYLSRSWHAGKNIPLVMSELNAFAHHHKQQSHMSILQLFLAPAYTVLSTLSGVTFDSSGLLAQLADVCNDDIVETAKVKNEMVFVRTSIALSMMEAIFLRDFVKASQVILKYQDFFQMLEEQQMRINEFEIIFYAGLVSFHMARETGEAHWMKKGMNALATFEKWSILNEWNFEHRFLLLKAELHHTKGDTSAAVEAYDMSAQAAQKHCFTHHVGLACELAAHYFGNIGEKERTREMIQRSHDAYMEWGAARKAKVVINLLELNWLDGS